MMLLGVMLVSLLTQAAPSPMTARAGWAFGLVEALPVQNGGRIKPLATLAGEVVLYVSARRSFPGFTPTELLLSWITEPQAWMNEKFIKISHPAVKQQLLLPAEQVRFSPQELFSNVTVSQYFGEFQARTTVKQKGAKPDVRERELERVLKSLMLFESVISGDAFSVVPAAPTWGTLAKSEQEKNPGLPIYQAYRDLIRAYAEGDRDLFESEALRLTRLYSEDVRKGLKLEAFYEHVRPEGWAWKLYLLATVLFGVVLFSKKLSWARLGGAAALALGVFAHIVSMAMRMLVSGRPPVTNMYESVLWVSFGILILSLYLYGKSRNLVTLVPTVALATLALVAAEAAPTLLDPTIQPLVPVLRSNAWLTIHVLVITLSYSAFAVSLGLANANLWYFWKNRAASQIEGLHQLMYRAIQIGVVMLAAGTILGGIWADYSWGRFWGWDPKETWALIALLAYLAILHARYVGWVKRFSFTAMTVVAFLTVLMAWYGVNFVLGAGLHSYGFSAGGQTWVLGFAMLELLAVALVAQRVRSRG